MASITFTEGTDVVKSKFVSSIETNVDVLEVSVSFDETASIGDELTYVDVNSNTVFVGLVQSIQTGATKDIVAYDFGSQLIDTNRNEIFASQSPEAIIEDIVTNDTDMTYSSTISSGITLSKYTAKDKRGWDIVLEMAEMLDASFRVDTSKVFHLELRGENNSSKSIQSGTDVIKGKWDEDAAQSFNKIIFIADQQIFQTVELASGTGAQTEFTLSESIIDIKVEHPIGTELTGGVDEVKSGDYTVDRENKEVTFAVAPASAANNIEFTYTFPVPIKITSTRASSIFPADRPKTKKVVKPYINRIQDARNAVNTLLDRFSEPFKSSVWIPKDQENWTGFVANEVINAIDGIRNISGDFIIKKIVRNYPGLAEVHIGELPDDTIDWQKETQFRVKQLEERDDNSTILQEYQNILQNLLADLQVRVTGFKKRDKGTCFYLNDDDNGLLRETATPYTITLCEETTGNLWLGISASRVPTRFPIALE